MSPGPLCLAELVCVSSCVSPPLAYSCLHHTLPRPLSLAPSPSPLSPSHPCPLLTAMRSARRTRALPASTTPRRPPRCPPTGRPLEPLPAAGRPTCASTGQRSGPEARRPATAPSATRRWACPRGGTASRATRWPRRATAAGTTWRCRTSARAAAATASRKVSRAHGIHGSTPLGGCQQAP